MKMHFKFSNLILTLLFVHPSLSAIKTWVASDHLEDVNSWNPPKEPCPQDKIVLPKTLPYWLKVSYSEVTVREVQLPIDGTIVFNTLVLHNGEPVKDCPGETLEYKQGAVHAWADPDNWVRETAINETQYIGDATPHLYRLPCVTDRVVVFSDYAQIERLPTSKQSIASLYWLDRNLTNDEWEPIEVELEQYTEDDDINNLRLVKVVNDDYLGSNYPYGEPPCQENIPREMCSDYARCKAPKCLQPVRPIYHCCDICGAVITIGTKESSSRVQYIASKVVEDYDGVEMWVGAVARNQLSSKNDLPSLYSDEWLKSTRNFYEIILVDVGIYNERSTSAAKQIIEELKDKLKLKIGQSMKLSGIPWAGPMPSPSGWEALITLVLVASALLAVVLYYYPPATFRSHFSQYTNLGLFTFARFENRSRAGSLVQAISTLSLNKEFDNPLYNDKEEEKQTSTEDLSSDSETHGRQLNAQVFQEGVVDANKSEVDSTFNQSTSMSELLKKDDNDESY